MSLLKYLEFPRECYRFWPRNLRGERTKVTGPAKECCLGNRGAGGGCPRRQRYVQVKGKGTSGPRTVGVEGRNGLREMRGRRPRPVVPAHVCARAGQLHYSEIPLPSPAFSPPGSNPDPGSRVQLGAWKTKPCKVCGNHCRPVCVRPAPKRAPPPWPQPFWSFPPSASYASDTGNLNQRPGGPIVGAKSDRLL